MSRLTYFFREAWTNLRANRWVTVVSVLTLSLTLMIFGLFLLVHENVASLSGSLREGIGITIFLKDEIDEAGAEKIQKQIQSWDGVDSTRYVSKAEALTRFQKELGGEIDLLEGLNRNPLPASVEVSVSPRAQDESRIAALADRIRNFPGVEEVQYNQEWLNRLNLFLRFLRMVEIGVGLLLALAGVAIIANTIRLKVYTRREEIEVMKYIGATDGFIEVPYFLEGILMGVLASGIAAALLALAYKLFVMAASDNLGMFWVGLRPKFLPWTDMAALFIGGAVLGGVGSMMSVKRFSRV